MAKDSGKDNVSKDDLLDKLVKELEKTHGAGSVMVMGKGLENKEISVIPTGCLSLDINLGVGGFPRGRIIEIYGNESSGKTTLALQTVAETQRRGGIAAFVDAEHALDVIYAEKLGVSVDKLIVSQPDNGEQALEIVDSLVRSNVVDLVVVDSVAALVPKDEIEGAMGDAHVGLQARLMSQALRKLAGSVNKSNAIVIFINQLRMKIGVMYGNPETTTGGVALKFYSSIRIEVRKGNLIREGKDAIGAETNIKVVKNKVAPPFREMKVDMIYGQGLSKEFDLFNLAVENGIIQRKGAWCSYIDDNNNEISLGQGKQSGVQYLKDNPDTMDYIEYKIRTDNGVQVPDELLAKFGPADPAKTKKPAKATKGSKAAKAAIPEDDTSEELIFEESEENQGNE